MNIAILGSGYVGLVTGTCLSAVGNNVTCFDIDKEKISLLNNNKTTIYEPGLKKIINESLKNKNLKFSSNIKETITSNNVIFIAVGTPQKFSGECDLSYINNVANSIGKYINDYKLIIVKSTVPVGSTINIKKLIEKNVRKRKKIIDFDIANNPEFLKQGKAVNDFMSPDRIIVGIENEKIKEKFEMLYKPFSLNHEKLIFMDIASSELTKYAANAMLATKISFINEIANISDKVGADINLVRKGIGSDSRIGYSFIYPSVGYGGSCFPKDVKALINFSKNKKYNAEILNAVERVNENQKKYFMKKILNRFSRNKKLEGLQFGIWGLSFKPGTDDMREAASIYIINEIINQGGKIKVFDPKAMENAKNIFLKKFKNISYCESKYDVLIQSDALILLTEWPEFRSPNLKLIKSKLNKPIIFDGRNQFDKKIMKKIGIEYHQIGVKSI